MPGNVANWERVLRVTAGVPLIDLAWNHTLYGNAGVAALAGGTLLLATGVLGRCPAYSLLGICTRR